MQELLRDDGEVWRNLNISLKLKPHTPPSAGEWWDVFRGFLVAVEYMADQRDVLSEVESDESLSPLYMPLSRRIEYMERWKMDFRGRNVRQSF